MNRQLRLRWLALAAVALLASACGTASAARWNARGNEAFANQEFDSAQAAYEQALAAQPNRPEALYNLGNTRFRQDAPDAAQEPLAAAAQAAAAQEAALAAEAFYNLGNARFAAGDFAGAVEAYKETLRRTPDDMDAKVNLELALRKQQENEQPSPTPSPSPTTEATPSPEPSPTPSPTPTPEEGASTPESTPTEPPTPTPETTPSPEATPTPAETPTATATGGAPPSPTAGPSPTAPGDGSPTPLPQTLPPGAMSEAQARQILEAATGDTQTLAERLQQNLPPVTSSTEKDW